MLFTYFVLVGVITYLVMYCDCPVFTRCCFCLPLRKGIIGFGYFNLAFSVFMVAISAYGIHEKSNMVMVFHASSAWLPVEACLVLHLIEIAMSICLLYGTHRQIVTYVKVFYFYDLVITIGSVILQVITLWVMETFFFAIFMFMFLFMALMGFITHVYLLIATRSLIRKLEMSGPNAFENQLNHIVTGEIKDVNADPSQKV